MKENKKNIIVIIAFILIIPLIYMTIVRANPEMSDISPNLLGSSQGEQLLGSSQEEEELGLSGEEDDDDWEEQDEVLEPEAVTPSEEVILGISSLLFATGDPVSVSNFIEFKNAVQGGVPEILITQGFTFTSNVNIPGDIVIDGGRNTISEGSLFNLNAGGVNSTVVIKNMTIIGYTHYGFVTTVRAGGTRATVIYDNVDYTGPQLGFFRKENTLIIKNSRINITSNGTPGQEVQELAEVTRLELMGNVSIIKHDSIPSVYSLIWFQPSNAIKPTFLVHEGAYVNIDNRKSYFYYYPDTRGVDFIVEDNATLIMNMKTGWSYDINHYISNFRIGANTNVALTHTNAKYNYVNTGTGHGGPEGGAFTIKESFFVGNNATFSLENAHQSYLTPLYFSANNIAIHIDNPKMLYIQGFVNGDVSNAINNVHLEAESINVWQKGQGHTQDPLLPTGDRGILSGMTTDGEKQTVIVNNYNDPMNFFRKAGNFSGILMGKNDFKLDNPLFESDITIDGTVDSPGDGVLAIYTERDTNILKESNAQANQQSRFSVDLGERFPSGKGPLVEGDLVDFEVYTTQHQFVGKPILHSLEARLVEGAEGGIYIKEVPNIQFGSQNVPSRTTILPRSENTSIVVEDSTNGASEWVLSAQATPLATRDNEHIMNENALGIISNGSIQGLSEPVVVWKSQGNPSNPIQTLEWEAGDINEGIVLQINPEDAIVGEYESTLTWTIQLAP